MTREAPPPSSSLCSGQSPQPPPTLCCYEDQGRPGPAPRAPGARSPGPAPRPPTTRTRLHAATAKDGALAGGGRCARKAVRTAGTEAGVQGRPRAAAPGPRWVRLCAPEAHGTAAQTHSAPVVSNRVTALSDSQPVSWGRCTHGPAGCGPGPRESLPPPPRPPRAGSPHARAGPTRLGLLPRLFTRSACCPAGHRSCFRTPGWACVAPKGRRAVPGGSSVKPHVGLPKAPVPRKLPSVTMKLGDSQPPHSRRGDGPTEQGQVGAQRRGDTTSSCSLQGLVPTAPAHAAAPHAVAGEPPPTR